MRRDPAAVGRQRRGPGGGVRRLHVAPIRSWRRATMAQLPKSKRWWRHEHVPAIELRSRCTRISGQPRSSAVSTSPSSRPRSMPIIGPNGAGKSTLFNLMTGLHPLTAGSIHLKGRRDQQSGATIDIARAGLARSFQVTNIFANMTVFENIRCGMMWNRGYKYSFWRFAGRQTDLTENCEAILQQTGAHVTAKCAGGAAFLFGPARPRNRHHTGQRCRRHPARRADRRHEPQRDDAGGRPDPHGLRGQDPGDRRA